MPPFHPSGNPDLWGQQRELQQRKERQRLVTILVVVAVVVVVGALGAVFGGGDSEDDEAAGARSPASSGAHVAAEYEVLDETVERDGQGHDLAVVVPPSADLEDVFASIRADYSDDGIYWVRIGCALTPSQATTWQLAYGHWLNGDGAYAAGTDLASGESEFRENEGAVCPIPGVNPSTPVFPGGATLPEYEGSPTYQWRVNAISNQDALLGAMQAIAPHLDEGDFSDVISTCDNLSRGATLGEVAENGVSRYSGGSDEQVTPGEAADLVDAAIQYACPEFG